MMGPGPIRSNPKPENFLTCCKLEADPSVGKKMKNLGFYGETFQNERWLTHPDLT